MDQKASNPRPSGARSLEQAASTIFVLTTLLPFLIFVWTLYTIDAMHNVRVQIGLGLSLVVSLLGFSVLRSVMHHTSEILHLLVRAETRDIPAAPQSATAQSAPATTRQPQREPGASAKAAAAADVAPALGAIQELREATDAVARRWKRQAEPLIGRQVVVSVVNVDELESGMLVRLTDDGMILEQDGTEFGVLWRLVGSIDLAPSADNPGPAVV